MAEPFVDGRCGRQIRSGHNTGEIAKIWPGRRFRFERDAAWVARSRTAYATASPRWSVRDGDGAVALEPLIPQGKVIYQR
jgi:hypothetical protein